MHSTMMFRYHVKIAIFGFVCKTINTFKARQKRDKSDCELSDLVNIQHARGSRRSVLLSFLAKQVN